MAGETLLQVARRVGLGSLQVLRKLSDEKRQKWMEARPADVVRLLKAEAKRNRKRAAKAAASE